MSILTFLASFSALLGIFVFLFSKLKFKYKVFVLLFCFLTVGILYHLDTNKFFQIQQSNNEIHFSKYKDKFKTLGVRSEDKEWPSDMSFFHFGQRFTVKKLNEDELIMKGELGGEEIILNDDCSYHGGEILYLEHNDYLILIVQGSCGGESSNKIFKIQDGEIEFLRYLGVFPGNDILVELESMFISDFQGNLLKIDLLSGNLLFRLENLGYDCGIFRDSDQYIQIKSRNNIFSYNNYKIRTFSKYSGREIFLN